MVLSYNGSTEFEIYGIYWAQDGVEHRIDQFCIPPNHFYLATESGTTQCTDFESSFTINNPTMTMYIDYSYRGYDDGPRYNGVISPAIITDLSVTASTFSESNDDQITLRLYWDRNIYECFIWLTSTAKTFSCNESDFNLVQSNCNESAFAVGVAPEDDSVYEIESISLTDEDGNIQVMNISACYGRAMIIDFTTVWGGTSINIYPLEVNSDSMCFDSKSYYISCH